MEVVKLEAVRIEGSPNEYPPREGYKPAYWFYTSDMIDLALRRDDPAAFVHFMRMAGCDRTTKTVDLCSMEFYCKKRNALKCLDALDQLEPLEMEGVAQAIRQQTTAW